MEDGAGSEEEEDKFPCNLSTIIAAGLLMTLLSIWSYIAYSSLVSYVLSYFIKLPSLLNISSILLDNVFPALASKLMFPFSI